MRRFHVDRPGFAAAFAAFVGEPRGEDEAGVDEAVSEVIEAVRRDGIDAVLDFTRRFDGIDLSAHELRVSGEEIEAGAAACPKKVREAIAFAADRIGAFHRRQKPQDERFIDSAGVELGWRWRGLASVGIYVPGGRAAYPSTVLMNAIPAAVAGVPRIAMASPPGRLEPVVLAAAAEAGVSEIWRIGGAQAIAALAFGAGPISPVAKIVGPGNAYVTAAKRRLAGKVGIDSLAGPSEIVVVADERSNPAWIAADLLSQAEHDPDAQAILITSSGELADAVESEIVDQLALLPTREDAAASLSRHGAIIIAPLEAAARLVDEIAPEHVELSLDDPAKFADRLHCAGAIFLGRWAPEAIGDYVAGSNHVLPTARTARFSSGLSVFDFLTRTSIIGLGEEAFAALAPAAQALAEAEGLAAHARSLSIRRDRGR
ncbi:MAG: histidinol dehydrogenase [Caulobacteraceae bacterium]